MMAQLADHQIQAIRASLVAALEQLDGLIMVLDAQRAVMPEPSPVQEDRSHRVELPPTFGRAKVPAAPKETETHGK